MDGSFPVQWARQQFPALARAGRFVFFDNAAGAQVPADVFTAMHDHLLEHMVQRGGRYPQSRAVDEMLVRAREAVASLLNARAPGEIAFGLNATSFIRQVSLAIGQSLGPRREIILTDLDHESNIATWKALDGAGASFATWRMREDGLLHVEDLAPLLSERTRLVACPVAANSLGSLIDVRGVADLAHAAGAEVFLDCVHYGPHGPIDVQAFDCDYLVCSGYKIFGPHMGFLWGRYELLQKLPFFREDFIPDEPPGKIEAGTVCYENIAGMEAAIGYLQRLGRELHPDRSGQPPHSRRAVLVRAMNAILEYERGLSAGLLEVLEDCGARIHGIADRARLSQRVPTICFNLERCSPASLTGNMARAGFGIRDGHMYSPRVMQRLGLPLESGTVRVSLVHYNTREEIQRFGEALRTAAR